MGYTGTRAALAAERREQRDEQRRQRELDRRNKELAKLSIIEQAKLEVEIYENQLEVLLSIHKTQGEAWDWMALAAPLTPPLPQRNSGHEIKARQSALVLHPLKRAGMEEMIAQAKALDDQLFQAALETYAEENMERERLRNLALRILAGEPKAFIEALVELSPLSEITDVGSLIHFTVESKDIIRCELKVNGSQAIPSEVKTLTATGKLSIKPMPRARFHELYQDYICGCALRVAREVLAMLPVNVVLLTAYAEIPDLTTGKTAAQPVLSSIMPRPILGSLDFKQLDPSDAMGNFSHRSNFKATRKAGAFQPITPLPLADIVPHGTNDLSAADLLVSAQKIRAELKSKMEELMPVIME